MDYRPKNLRSTVLLGAAAFLSALLRSDRMPFRARGLGINTLIRPAPTG